MSRNSRDQLLLTPHQLYELIKNDLPVVVLAIQSINPYTGKSLVMGTRIPGAIDAQAYTDFASEQTPVTGQRPLPHIVELQDAARRWGLRHDRTVVVYDNDRSLTAARAWWVLRWAGLPDVRVLDGGFLAWQTAGLPTTTSILHPLASNITLKPGQMPELDAKSAAQIARDGVLIDARIRPNYIGGKVTPSEPARGHIPGAISAPTLDNLTDFGNFTDNNTLREMYRVHAVDGSRDVGVYCGAGMSAAHTVLALAAIGIESAMYVGSWSEWVLDSQHPVIIGADAG